MTRLARAITEALEARRLLSTTFTVTTTADTVDPNDGVLSLREAITAANALPNVGGPDRIEFDIAPGGPQTIRPASALPSITSGVFIDGRTQPGYAGTPIIQISGELAGANVDGLRVGSLASTVRGLVISRFSANGIQITNLASQNVIVGNYIGTDITGAAAAGNARGILLRGFNNVIGGTTPEDRNVISGNTSSSNSLGRGIEVNGTAATGNVIQGNYVGVDASGAAALRNTGDGISVINAPGNTIGGSAPGAGNVISGNTRVGLFVTTAASTGNWVLGNYIGTNAAGTSALGNVIDGILLQAGASHNVIGTDGDGINDAAEGNLISGNRGPGVSVNDSGTAFNVVSGNLIGTDATGNVSIGNVGQGVLIQRGASDNQIGTSLFNPVPAQRNVISATTTNATGGFGDGVKIQDASYNRVTGNYIGTDGTGTAALGNARFGVFVQGNSTGTSIGDSVFGAGGPDRNIISANGGGGVFLANPGTQYTSVADNLIGTDVTGNLPLGNHAFGVRIFDAASNNYVFFNTIRFNSAQGVTLATGQNGAPQSNQIRHNSVDSNGGIGIDLGEDGVTPNDLFDADSGPNALLNTPVIDSVQDLGGGQILVTGGLFSLPNGFFYVDLYASPGGSPAAITQGARYLGTSFAFTDQTGYGAFQPTTVQLSPGEIVTATTTSGTSPDFGTSEFSSRVTADPGGPYVFNEGDGANGQLTVRLNATALDLGGDPVQVAWDLNNDGVFDDSTALAPTLIVSSADGPTDYPVSIRVTNSAGQSSAGTTVIRILNVAPTVTSASINSSENSPQPAGAQTIVTGTFTDPGLLDTHTVTVDWGDGVVQTLPVPRPANSATGSFTLTHTYATGGIYFVALMITDNNGGQSNAAYFNAYVTGIGVQNGVLNVVGTPGNDKVAVTTQADGTVNVAASFLPSPVQFNGWNLFRINVVLGDKNDQASVLGNFWLGVDMYGDDGNDTLTGGTAGYCNFFGGNGNDSLTAAGQGSDYLYGGAGNDILTGGPGFTYMDGEDGNDSLNAGPGYTVALGGAGNDTFFGGPASPHVEVYGGDGNDTLNGGSGAEYLSGGAGDDVINGGDGDDYITGDDGNDTIDAGAGNDWVFGGAGDDRIQGGDGNDTLTGGPGADFINGGKGTDSLGDPGDLLDTLISVELR